MSLIELDNPAPAKHAGGRPSKYDPAMCERAIELGNAGASITEIAHELGIHKDTLYNWIDELEEFSDAIKSARAGAQAWYERIARDNLIQDKDSKFNQATWIFTMKNRFREDYRDDVAAPSTTNNTINVFGLELLDQLIDRRQAQALTDQSKP